MTQMPPPSFNPGMKPHRGTMILILGILGIVLCFICGIFAFIMGGKDLQEMQRRPGEIRRGVFPTVGYP